MCLIDVKPEIEHARNASLGNDDVVDRLAEMFFAKLVPYISREQQSMLDVIIADENFSEMTFELLRFNIGEKSERSDVNSANRHHLIGETPANAEQGSVAAD